MRRAIELAQGGRGRVAPNPLVGAVITRDGEVIGEGFHAELGGIHAEVAALEACRRRGNDPAGATLHVTLEPCAHQGRQPPCTDAILAAGIARVEIGADDPTGKASGRGPGILRDGGVEVAFAEGGEAAAARLCDQAFRKHARTGRPLVVHKVAASLDGRTTTPRGAEPWISGPESRELVHRWRAEAGAIAVGIGTALADDPLLTARIPGAARQPLRVVFDSEARLPLGSRLLTSLDEAKLLVFCGSQAPPERVEGLRDAGAEVVPLAERGADGVEPALAELGRREINSLLLEGGATLAGSFFEAGEIDELRFFLAPVLLGHGSPIYGARGGGGSELPLHVEWERSGSDMLVRARLREW
jgi:diaminohydroxyphosphoribosylaminopyrimidine deaminase/5-amino-6-(5-phosphoribosylamino)uracil reductase